MLEYLQILPRAFRGGKLIQDYGGMVMLKKLASYMKGLWHLAAISALGMIIEAICELSLPSIASSIYEMVNAAPSSESVRRDVILYGIGMLVLAILGLAGGLATMKASSICSQDFAFRLRNDVYKKISTFSFKNIDEFSTASLTTRLTNDITMLQMVVMMALRILVRDRRCLSFRLFLRFLSTPK